MSSQSETGARLPVSQSIDVPVERSIASKRERLFFIDNLRWFLTILVLVLHLSITYGGSGSWYYQDPAKDELTALLLTIVTATNQAFFMGLFFLISAYFLPGSYKSKGPGLLSRDRLVRLGIPLLFYTLCLHPLVNYIAQGFQGTYLAYWGQYLTHWQEISTGPTWFVEALLIFTAGYVIWRLLVHHVQNKVDRVQEQRFPSWFVLLSGALGLAVLSFLVRILFPIGWVPPVFNLQLAFFVQYILLFMLGIMAYHRGWLFTIPDNKGRVGLWMVIGAIILFPIVAIAGDAMHHIAFFMGGWHWQALVFALWEATVCLGMCLFLLTLFRKRFNQQGWLTSFLAKNAYTVYIIHPLVLVGVAVALRGLMLYPLLKFILALIIAVPCSFALGFVVRKIPFADHVL